MPVKVEDVMMLVTKSPANGTPHNSIGGPLYNVTNAPVKVEVVVEPEEKR